jgi:hypothetical protein
LNGELLQEFAAAVEQLTHLTLVRSPDDFIQREAAYVSLDRVKNWDV